jgi:MoxR-like ATPase
MNQSHRQFYTGKTENWPRLNEEKRRQAELPSPVVEDLHSPEHYIASDELVNAVNVALMLGQPLLLTGNPGTGKTDFALNVARELGLAMPLKVAVKSTTTAENLLYHFDAVRQFRDASLDAAESRGSGGMQKSARARYDVKPYITYVGLGRAILLSREPDEVREFWEEGINGQFSGPIRSLVLIDEVDKAERDVPNDLLNEVDRCEFSIPELGNRSLKASRNYWPIVIFTSNAERSLPEAFLRRCIYFHIEFPSEEQLTKIIEGRVSAYSKGSDLVKDAIRFLKRLRPESGESVMSRPPSTAELLGWLRYMSEQKVPADSLLKDVWKDPPMRSTALGVLAKTIPDREVLSRLIDSEVGSSKTSPSDPPR